MTQEVSVAFAVAAGMPVQSSRPPVPYIERSLL